MGTVKGHAVGLGKEAKLRQHSRHPAGLLNYLSCLPSELRVGLEALATQGRANSGSPCV